MFPKSGEDWIRAVVFRASTVGILLPYHRLGVSGSRISGQIEVDWVPRDAYCYPPDPFADAPPSS